MYYTTEATIDIRKVLPAGTATLYVDGSTEDHIQVTVKNDEEQIINPSDLAVTIVNSGLDSAGYILVEGIPIKDGNNKIRFTLTDVIDADSPVVKVQEIGSCMVRKITSATEAEVL